ncbi:MULTISPECIES: GntR family transcriptional regulator [unclassified Azospirillum]|uniref:GntR family transcriptional regulator n=1 Tax=unclassified Azospirillum TaxID=2630922 RepID=UPI0013050119|nr:MULTISPECIES: GntR family transcriptional regulator [unclassified Azospirillum]
MDAAQPGRLLRPKSLTTLVVEEIRSRIVEGDLQLGETISENALAQDLGISKTPVRDAMQQLRAEGLVDILPSRGTVVFSMSADDVEQLGTYRELLETAAVRLCMEREPSILAKGLAEVVGRMHPAIADDDLKVYRHLDADFHQCIFESSGNQYLLEAYMRVSVRIQALRTRLSLDPKHIRDSYNEHIQMLDMVRGGRTDDLVALMSFHVSNTKRSFLAKIGRLEDEHAASSRRQRISRPA